MHERSGANRTLASGESCGPHALADVRASSPQIREAPYHRDVVAAVVSRTHRLQVVTLTALLAVVWLALAPRTPDLAAAVYRTGLFAREGFQLYDAAWYGGHHLLGYSLVFPELAAVIGARPTGVLAAIVSTFLFERLAVGWWGPRGRAAAACYALAVIGDLMIGRLTFSLGVAVGLGSLLALQRGRPRLAAALA